MEGKKAKSEKIEEGQAEGVNEDGELVKYTTEKIRLVDTAGNEKIIEKPKGESQSKKAVKQSELIQIIDPNKEYVNITGVPVEVDYEHDTQVVVLIGDAYDYYLGCQAHGRQLVAMNPDKPETTPYASDVTFDEYVQAMLDYWRKEAALGWPVIYGRADLRVLDDPTLTHQNISFTIQAAEDSIVAYEKYLAMSDIDRKILLNDAVIAFGERREGRQQREVSFKDSLDEAIRQGYDLTPYMDKLSNN